MARVVQKGRGIRRTRKRETRERAKSRHCHRIHERSASGICRGSAGKQIYNLASRWLPSARRPGSRKRSSRLRNVLGGPCASEQFFAAVSFFVLSTAVASCQSRPSCPGSRLFREFRKARLVFVS